MNPATQSGSPRRGLHPLVASAAVSIIILSAVAVAAMLGWLPSISANPQAESAQSGPEAANLAPAPPAPGSPKPARTRRCGTFIRTSPGTIRSSPSEGIEALCAVRPARIG